MRMKTPEPRKKKSAKELAQDITYRLVERIQERVDEYLGGETWSSITPEESKFLQDVIKLEQEQEQGDAVVSYLNSMETDELEAYHERLKKHLEEGEGLN
jgi:hypothetical protein